MSSGSEILKILGPKLLDNWSTSAKTRILYHFSRLNSLQILPVKLRSGLSEFFQRYHWKNSDFIPRKCKIFEFRKFFLVVWFALQS